MKHYITVIYSCGTYLLNWEAEDADHAVEQARNYLGEDSYTDVIEAVIPYRPWYCCVFDRDGLLRVHTTHMTHEEADMAGMRVVNLRRPAGDAYRTYTIQRESYL